MYPLNRDYLHEEIVQDNGFYLVQSAHCDFKGVMEIKAVFFYHPSFTKWQTQPLKSGCQPKHSCPGSLGIATNNERNIFWIIFFYFMLHPRTH